MAETLEITRQAAIKAHDEASTEGKTLLENLFGKRVFQKDIKERIKTFDDVIQYLESFIHILHFHAHLKNTMA